MLLTTPLIRSLKRAWPDAAIDVLVFRGTEGILAGNPDIADVITMPERAGAGESLALLRKLWRRYDLAISTQSGDRPTLFAWAAGRRSVGFVERRRLMARDQVAGARLPGRGRRRHCIACTKCCVLRRRSASRRVPEVVAPGGLLRRHRAGSALCGDPCGADVPLQALDARRAGSGSRRGSTRAGLRWWRRAARTIAHYLDEVWAGAAAGARLDGALAWPRTCRADRGRALYVGPGHVGDASRRRDRHADGRALRPDRSAPVGPVAGRRPRPAWDAAGTIQNRGNVWLVQNPPSCPWSILPCQQEGCERHLDSHSQCLDELAVSQVLSAVDAALAGGRPAAARASGA